MLDIKNSVKCYWVKKLISSRDWNNWYSLQGTYCKLGSEGVGRGKQVEIGFLVAKQIPYDCVELNDEELRQVDLFRRAKNIRPFPLEEVAIEKPKDEIEKNPEFPPDFVLPPAGF